MELVTKISLPPEVEQKIDKKLRWINKNEQGEWCLYVADKNKGLSEEEKAKRLETKRLEKAKKAAIREAERKLKKEKKLNDHKKLINFRADKRKKLVEARKLAKKFATSPEAPKYHALFLQADKDYKDALELKSFD